MSNFSSFSSIFYSYLSILLDFEHILLIFLDISRYLCIFCIIYGYFPYILGNKLCPCNFIDKIAILSKNMLKNWSTFCQKWQKRKKWSKKWVQKMGPLFGSIFEGLKKGTTFLDPFFGPIFGPLFSKMVKNAKK